MNLKLNRRQSAIAGATTLAAVVAGSAQGQSAADDQWWRWRGPRGNNHAAPGATPPSSISRDSLVWSTKIPGRGHSTPVVANELIFLTTANKSLGTQSVLCFDSDGKDRWERAVHTGGIPRENHPNNTEASPTLAFDGSALYASFYNSSGIQLTKLLPDGKVVWQKEVGKYAPRQYKYGYAASPLIYQDQIIVNADFDGEAFLASVDRRSGQIVWKVRRPGKISFSSPIVANIAGRDQLLLSGGEMVAAYDPSNGRILWQAGGATTMATCGTMVWDGDLVFASGGYPESETVCVKADGSGKIMWSNRTKCYEQSMLAKDGYVYAVADSGVAYCWRASDGKTMWRQRLGGKFSSSPVLVGNTIIVFNELGLGFAFAAQPNQYRSLGQSKLADEIFSSPVVVGDTMYVRVAHKSGGRQEELLALK